MLGIELAAAATLAIVLLIDLVALEPTSIATALALTVLVVIAAGWMAATLVGLLRGQAWVRASAIVWQVLQFAIGLGAFEGSFAQLLFVPSVVKATQGRAGSGG